MEKFLEGLNCMSKKTSGCSFEDNYKLCEEIIWVTRNLIGVQNDELTFVTLLHYVW